MEKTERFTFWLYIFLILTIILAGCGDIYHNDKASLGMSVLALIFISLPSGIEKQFRLEFPSKLKFVFILFLYASIFLGTANHYYVRFWWWDKMLHGFSGLIFANLGFLIFMYLNGSNEMDSRRIRILAAAFSFCFAVAMGDVWEIYEYTMDKTFGFMYQGVGIDDTMTDIIFDTLGALIFALIIFLKKKEKLKLISKQRNVAKCEDKSNR
jgi:uncharacterized membrane protein YjdF